MILTLAGGALFGPVVGTVINLAGAGCGATLSFLITRHLIYDWFNQKRGKRLNRLIHGVDEKGWLFVAFLRLIPIIPFSMVNYGLGLTGIGFRVYLITTLFFLLPAEIVYTYFGYASIGALSQPKQLFNSGCIILLGLALGFIGVVHLLQKKHVHLFFNQKTPAFAQRALAPFNSLRKFIYPIRNSNKTA
jgi:uncharacterized membrane protein YdjX (TVP38/TMEM64 family)